MYIYLPDHDCELLLVRIHLDVGLDVPQAETDKRESQVNNDYINMYVYMCGKQWQSYGLQAWGTETVRVRGGAGGASGGAARGAAGTVPEQRALGALRPARAQRADSRRCKTKARRRTRKRMPLDTTKHKQGGHGPPPRCLDNCANNNMYIYIRASPSRCWSGCCAG